MHCPSRRKDGSGKKKNEIFLCVSVLSCPFVCVFVVFVVCRFMNNCKIYNNFVSNRIRRFRRLTRDRFSVFLKSKTKRKSPPTNTQTTKESPLNNMSSTWTPGGTMSGFSNATTSSQETHRQKKKNDSLSSLSEMPGETSSKSS